MALHRGDVAIVRSGQGAVNPVGCVEVAENPGGSLRRSELICAPLNEYTCTLRKVGSHAQQIGIDEHRILLSRC